MSTLNKILKKEELSREEMISSVSALSIAINIALSAIKLLAGIAASSAAIISEGVNSAADALSSLLALVGTKLAGKKPDEKHPFGYGRIEHLTGLVIAVIILLAGIEMLKNAVSLIIHPEPVDISYISLIIVAVSAVIKLLLGSFMIRTGERTGSSALMAVGKESRGDCLVSVVTIISTVIYLFAGKSVDAYAAALTSLYIIKNGVEVMMGTVSELIGRSGRRELADKLYHEIRQTEGIVNAADMILHSYGPDAYTGSCNIEIDHKKTIGEIYQSIHKLQLRIMHEYRVTMVFGIYAVDNDSPSSKEMRELVASFIRGEDLVKSYHALFLDDEINTLYCDFIVDYALDDWDALRERFARHLESHRPGTALELTIETDYIC